MRKVSAIFVVILAVAYFFLVPEDHARELEFPGLTVGEVPSDDAPVLVPDGTASIVDPTEVGLVAPPEEVDGTIERADVEQRREPVRSQLGTLEEAGEFGDLGELDDLGAAGIEDGIPVPLPGDVISTEGEGQLISGRVVDVEGHPQPGVRVRVEHAYLPSVTGSSDPKGAFRLRPAEPRGELVLATGGWVLLGGERTLREERTEGYLLVVAKPVIVRGKVLDELGRPIDGARIHGFAPSNSLVPFGTPALPLDHEQQTGFSNARGEFEVGPLPLLAGTRIEFRMDGHVTQTLDLPQDARAPMAVVLPQG